MSRLQVELPPEITENEALLLLALKLYETGRMSLGRAANLAGYSKRAFMEILAKQNIPIFNYSPEELDQEVVQ